MAKFSVGDEVVFVNEKQQGIIRTIRPDGIHVVEIEDGFTIDVLANEIAIFKKWHPLVDSPAEQKEIKKQETESALPPMPDLLLMTSGSGLFQLAFIPEHQKILSGKLSVALVNGTAYQFLVALYTGMECFHAQEIAPNATSPLIALPSNNERLQVHFIVCRPAEAKQRIAFQESVQIPLIDLHQRFPAVPAPWCFLQTETLYNTLDTALTDLSKLKERFGEKDAVTRPLQSSLPKQQPAPRRGGASSAIDLHIEELTNDTSHLDNAQMLNIQLQAFRKELDGAILRRLPSIVFIHGVGNGRLKAAIRKELQELKLNFSDGDYSLYGSGATEVKL